MSQFKVAELKNTGKVVEQTQEGLDLSQFVQEVQDKDLPVNFFASLFDKQEAVLMQEEVICLRQTDARRRHKLRQEKNASSQTSKTSITKSQPEVAKQTENLQQEVAIARDTIEDSSWRNSYQNFGQNSVQT